MIDRIQTIIHSVHNNIAKCDVIGVDLTLTPCYVAKFGNFFSHGDTAKEAYSNAKKKYDDNLPIDDKIRMFIERHPKLDTYVTASELFNEHNFLTGSCDFGRRKFCEEHNIDIKSGSFTVNEFIEFTINSYGGNVIRKLKEEYESKIKIKK